MRTTRQKQREMIQFINIQNRFVTEFPVLELSFGAVIILFLVRLLHSRRSLRDVHRNIIKTKYNEQLQQSNHNRVIIR